MGKGTQPEFPGYPVVAFRSAARYHTSRRNAL